MALSRNAIAFLVCLGILWRSGRASIGFDPTDQRGAQNAQRDNQIEGDEGSWDDDPPRSHHRKTIVASGEISREISASVQDLAVNNQRSPIRRHQSRSLPQIPPPSVLFFLSHGDDDHCGITVFHDDPKRTPDRLLIVPRSPHHRRRPFKQLCMSFPCNGLICISDYSNGCMELLNPTTGERHTTPPHHPTAVSLLLPCLGFHPETKEYKVVRFFRLVDEEGRVGCEVYTLGTNSWRQIPYHDYCLSHYSAVNANGALYWQIYIHDGYDGRDHELVSLDLKNETFARISSPNFMRVYHEKRHVIGCIAELQGSVCLQVYTNSLEQTDIWMMVLSSNGDENTMHEWGLKYSVGCFISSPLFIHNERILASYNDCHRLKSKDKEEPPPLVYHHLDCKDGCSTEVYRGGKPVSPLVYHCLKGQDGSNYEEFYRDTGIHSSMPFTHVESLVSLPNQ